VLHITRRQAENRFAQRLSRELAKRIGDLARSKNALIDMNAEVCRPTAQNPG